MRITKLQMLAKQADAVTSVDITESEAEGKEGRDWKLSANGKVVKVLVDKDIKTGRQKFMRAFDLTAGLEIGTVQRCAEVLGLVE